MAGITKLDPKLNLTKFVIHHKTEHDYYFKYHAREQLVEIIKQVYFMKTKLNLKIFYVQTKTLDRYTTQKKDREKGICRLPPDAQIATREIRYDENAETKLGVRRFTRPAIFISVVSGDEVDKVRSKSAKLMTMTSI